MNTIVLDTHTVRIPAWVVDLDSFRRWVQSDDFPEGDRICCLDGEVWIDMSKEQIFTHNQLKGEFNVVVGGFVKREQLGRYFPDGVLVTNTEANLSSQPDGVFVASGSLQAEKVRLVEGVGGGYVEFEDTPDIVLEVVSTSSVEKDTEVLPDVYWRAGSPEYWLVDARGDEPTFDILRHSSNGYVETQRRSRWLRSEVLGVSFGLTRQTDSLGHSAFTLQVQVQ